MIQIVIDTSIIVAFITLFGVIFTSLIAPVILKYFETNSDNEGNK